MLNFEMILIRDIFGYGMHTKGVLSLANAHHRMKMITRVGTRADPLGSTHAVRLKADLSRFSQPS